MALQKKALEHTKEMLDDVNCMDSYGEMVGFFKNWAEQFNISENAQNQILGQVKQSATKHNRQIQGAKLWLMEIIEDLKLENKTK